MAEYEYEKLGHLLNGDSEVLAISEMCPKSRKIRSAFFSIERTQ